MAAQLSPDHGRVGYPIQLQDTALAEMLAMSMK
jgi:hypothetical protein